MFSQRRILCALLSTLTLGAVATVSAHSPNSSSTLHAQRQAENTTGYVFDRLFEGNKQFRNEIEAEDPGLLDLLAEKGQHPEFMLLGCSDSRVSEGTIFKADPGVLFTERNIGNLYDTSTQAVVSYAISSLGVKQLIVLGHYGCGGVAASIAAPPPLDAFDAGTVAVQNWIAPLRTVYASSNRSEIVELRESDKWNVEPALHDPGYRALIEESVKWTVKNIAHSQVVLDHNAHVQSGSRNKRGPAAWRYGREPEEETAVFVHGWVYDVENGEIHDLGVSVGPPGVPVPKVPFPRRDVRSCS